MSSNACGSVGFSLCFLRQGRKLKPTLPLPT